MTDLTTTPWSDPVASVCDVCGKGPGFGNNVSYSHRRTPRRWNPNIQRLRVKVGTDAQAPERLHLLHQGRQGHSLTFLACLSVLSLRSQLGDRAVRR